MLFWKSFSKKNYMVAMLATVCFFVFAGSVFHFLTKKHQLDNNETDDIQNTAVSNNIPDNLPVIDNTSLYPSMSIHSLVEQSIYIFRGTVKTVEDTIIKKTERMSWPYTPVVLSVTHNIKNASEPELTYMLDGGVGENYIMKPSGHMLAAGMDVIVFLGIYADAWGGQGVFLIQDDNVILNRTAEDFFDASLISTMESTELDEANRSGSPYIPYTVEVVDVDIFIEKIQELIEQLPAQQ